MGPRPAGGEGANAGFSHMQHAQAMGNLDPNGASPKSYTTAVVRGDVAAVRAACDAGRTAGARVGDVVAVHVIARPHTGVDNTIPLGRGDAE